jgi:hypothetical protein
MVDKEAGHHVSMQQPEPVHAAIQMIRQYQLVQSAMYGYRKRKQEKPEKVFLLLHSTHRQSNRLCQNVI